MPDQILPQLEQLVIDTFNLWDVTRVGFSWRKYYLNHTYRVRNLSVQMGRDVGADTTQLTYATILHDITKRYDGSILKGPDGKSVVDEEGFWLNETMRPDRQNWVTDLYDRLELAGSIHHVSGAILTEHILREYGMDADFTRMVAKIVRGHLKPSGIAPEEMDERYREIEVRLVYDADTIDPNMGLTAFYRNIQINAGGWLKQGIPVDLKTYVEKLPGWVNGKDAFVDHLLSERGREVAHERQSEMKRLCVLLLDELNEYDVNARYGLLGVVGHLFTNPEDPSLNEHADALVTTWLPEREAQLAQESQFSRDQAEESLARARWFAGRLHHEIAGVA